MGLDDEFSQRVCDLLFEISQKQFSLDDGSVEAEADAGRRAVYTGLLMLNDDLCYQNEQREAAELETQTREARLRALFDLAKVAICDARVGAAMEELARHTVGGNGTPLEERADVVHAVISRMDIQTVNREALEMFGVAGPEELRQHLSGLRLDDGGRLLGMLWRGLAEGKRRMELEGPMSRSNGERLTVLAGMSLVDDDSGGRTAIMTFADITAHHARVVAEREAAHRTEELARVNGEVERLFYAVAHDLRSPLRAVDTLAQWIVDDFEAGDIEEVRDHVKTLRSRITRLDRMLNDLLSYARIGRTQHPVENVDVGGLLNEVVTTMVELPPGFDVTWQGMPQLTTHRTLLSQVFQNLISNAVKHHDGERGRIEISVERSGPRYTFRVTDDGPGIALGHRDRIFGLFSTLKRRDEVEGSGMGLAFVQKVVRRVGGHVVAEGPEGRGITFKFDWPNHIGPDVAPAAEPRTEEAKETPS